MKGLFSLLIGLFGTFAFSWVGLTVIPNFQIGHLEPQSDEEGTDIYPMPQSGMVERGRHVYTANGCVYCHSEQVRADYAGPDIERKWGERRSAPRDYIFARPVLLGKERVGQDLANIGQRAPAEEESPAPSVAPSPAGSPVAASPAAKAPAPAAKAPTSAAKASPPAAKAPAPVATPPQIQSTPGSPPKYSAAWQHLHLYSPRSFYVDSDMPAYRFLYEKRHIDGERSNDALDLTGSDAPPAGWEIVPTYDAKCLVAYLMSLNQSHPLNEVKTAPGPAAAPAGSPAAAPAASPAAPKGAKAK